MSSSENASLFGGGEWKKKELQDFSEQNSLESLCMLKEDLKHFFISLALNLKFDNTVLESTFAEDGKNLTFGVHFLLIQLLKFVQLGDFYFFLQPFLPLPHSDLLLFEILRMFYTHFQCTTFGS